MFYNNALNDPICQSQAADIRYSETLRDFSHMARCTGSGWALKRQAYDEVGGFPDATLTEDADLTILLLAAGWKTAYVAEALQWGLIPDTYRGHVNQFSRWVSFSEHSGAVPVERTSRSS